MAVIVLAEGKCLGPNVLFPFTNTYIMWSSVTEGYQIWHSYKIASKIIVLYILIVRFICGAQEYTKFLNDW